MWTSPSRLLTARVAGQFGLITRRQALGGGLTRKTIECHLRSGRWVAVHPGVYLTSPGRDDWQVRALAALLWCGPGADLFGESAGHEWGLVTSEPHIVTVVVPSDRVVREVPDVKVTRSRHCRARVDPQAWPHRIQARHTVLDLGQGASVDRVIALSAKAIDLGLCSAAALTEALADRPRQAHWAVLTEALADVAAGAESAAEVRYVRDVERAHGLPAGHRQAPFGSLNRRDVAYDDFDLLVEIDGRLGHDDWTGRQRDGRRDRAAAVTGRITLRCFWTDLVPRACDLALEIAAILHRQGWQQMPRPCGRHCPARDVA